MSFDWKSLLGTVAPTIATALGGPVAGLAVSALEDALGIPKTSSQTAVAQAVANATPEQMLALKKCESDFVIKMKELDIDVMRIDADDRKSARDRATAMRDWTPQIIGGLLLVVWATINSCILSGYWTPKISPELVGRILGMLDGSMAMFFAWLYGTNRSSQTKDDTIKAMTR